MATMASTLLRAARNASRAAAAASNRAAAMASHSAGADAVAAAASRAAALPSRSARVAARAARLDSGVTLKSCPTRGDVPMKPRDRPTHNGSTKPREGPTRDDVSKARDGPTRDDGSTKPRDGPTRDEDYTKARDEALRYISFCADYLSDDEGIIPMDKDIESDDAVWALYKRWCKAFNKKRDHAEMARRFKLFKHYAQYVHNWNTHVPENPKLIALHRRKRRQVELLLSKGKDLSHIHEQFLSLILYKNTDGRDPFLNENEEKLLKQIEEKEQ